MRAPCCACCLLVAARDRGSEGLADAIGHYEWLVWKLSGAVRREVSRIEVEVALGRDAVRDLAETRLALEDCARACGITRVFFVFV